MIHLYAIGSPIEQDNLAWQYVDSIHKKLTTEYPAINIEYFDRPGMQLVNEISGKQKVILVDALLSDTLCEVQSLQANDLQQQTIHFSSHNFGVAEALLISQQLNLLPEDLWILGIPTPPQTDNEGRIKQQLSKQLLHKIQNIIKPLV